MTPSKKYNPIPLQLIVFVACLLTSLQQQAQSGCNLPTPSLYTVDYNTLNQSIFTYDYSFDESLNYEGGCDVGTNRMNKRLKIKLDLGEDYEFGLAEWKVEFKVHLEVVANNNLGVQLEKDLQFSINQDQPEQLAIVELFSNNQLRNILLYQESDKIDFTITDLEASDLVKNYIRVQLYHELDERIGVKDVTVTPLSIPTQDNVVTSNPINFQWTPSCNCTPNFEFQLLRLFNQSEGNSNDEESIIAHVDWSKALSIETQSADPTIVLSVVEGTGYYAWRVRPIGSVFPNGNGDHRNWGKWSDYTFWENIENNNQQLQISDLDWIQNKPQLFFYRQFDDNKNWIYSRSFSEAAINGKVKIAEEITYANGLLQVEQHQKHLYSQGNIVANRTILDYAGRPALSTIYAPIEGQNHLGFLSNFATTDDGEKYSAKYFDEDEDEDEGEDLISFKNPAKITGGHIYNYYSDNNPDKYVPSAEGYPFSRSLYYGDGMDRVKEASGIGKQLRIQPDNPHTSRFYYSGVSDTELVRIFGDEAPKPNSVIKMIAVDPNQTVTVTYQDKNGQTLATCLSANDNTAHHDPLPSRGDFAVVDEITGNVSCGDGCLLSSKTVSFNTPTTITLNYELTPSTINEMCTNQCRSCDYHITFSIKRIDDPFDATFPVDIDPLIIPPSSCEELATLPPWSYTYNLPVGTFLIERRIEVYNTNPNSIDAEEDPFGDTYLEEQLIQLETQLAEEITSDPLWKTIKDYLENAETEQLYEYLIANHNMSPLATEFTFTAGCCEFTLPVSRCEDCPIQNQDFEAYFNEFYPFVSSTETPFADDPNTTALEYLPNFQHGHLNTMIQNMLEEEVPYSYTELCNCWSAIVPAWAGMNQEIDGDITYEPDLLNTFLNCTGRRVVLAEEESTNPSPEFAYQWTYIKGSNPICEQTICLSLQEEESPFYMASVTCINGGIIDWEQTTLSNEQWDIFYNCILARQASITPEEAASLTQETAQEMMSACNDACENRLQSFITALEYYYEVVIGANIVNHCDNATPFPLSAGDCISLSTLYCQANQLVQLCQQNCSPLSPIYDGNTLTAYGTQTEIEAYQQAMYYSFELAQSNELNTCPEGFELSTTSINSTSIDGDQFAQLVVNYLNEQWINFMNNSIENALFNLTETLNNFYPNLSESCQSPVVPVLYLPVEEGSYFEVQNCKLVLISERKDSQIICTNICKELASQLWHNLLQVGRA